MTNLIAVLVAALIISSAVIFTQASFTFKREGMDYQNLISAKQFMHLLDANINLLSVSAEGSSQQIFLPETGQLEINSSADTIRFSFDSRNKLIDGEAREGSITIMQSGDSLSLMLNYSGKADIELQGSETGEKLFLLKSSGKIIVEFV